MESVLYLAGYCRVSAGISMFGSCHGEGCTCFRNGRYCIVKAVCQVSSWHRDIIKISSCYYGINLHI